MLAILMATYHAPKNSNLRISSDNQACIYAVSKGISPCNRMQQMVDTMHKLMGHHNKTVVIEWVASPDNPSDVPSRVADPYPPAAT